MRSYLIRLSFVGCVLVWSLVDLAGASPFVNLDFEQATVSPPNSGIIDANLAFPGWTAQVGGVARSSVYYDTPSGGEPVIALYDHPDFSFFGMLLQGQYMAAFVTGNSPATQVSLTQIGEIPAGTRSLVLLGDGDLGPARVFINGTQISMMYLSGIPAFGQVVRYGGDISLYGGQSVQLTLESPIQNFGRVTVDDLRFFASPIPEASPLILGWCYWIAEVFCRNVRARWPTKLRKKGNNESRSPSHGVCNRTA